MQLYTGRGDDGTTTLYGSTKRIRKDAAIIDALGSVDEVNSFIGWCKAKAAEPQVKKVLESVQHVLFIIQAEIAGAKPAVTMEQVQIVEKAISKISEKLKPIKGFVITGETELGAMFDVARTIARRAERCINKAGRQRELRIGRPAQAYLNRLSSLLYVLARQESVRARKREKSPKY